MGSKTSLLFTAIVYGHGYLWFDYVCCGLTDTHFNGVELSETYLKFKDRLKLATMTDIRRLIVCKQVAERGCRVFEMNISGYRCSSLGEEDPGVLMSKKGRTSTNEKMMKEAKEKMKPAYITCSGAGPCPAVCTSGICLCKPGLHLHLKKKLCFKACTKYGTDLIYYEAISITGHNRKRIYGTTRQACAEACLKKRSFMCTTFDFGGWLSVCYLSTSTYYTVSLSERETITGWMLGARNCIE